jgi:long-chain fatty acid transport protein
MATNRGRGIGGILAAASGGALLLAPPVGASGLELFQQGGRGVAQAGALVARADEPSAVRYNPAGLVDADGLELQLGLDFSNRNLELRGAATGSVSAKHQIQLAPLFHLAWRPRTDACWAVGVGLDSPAWALVEWPATLAAGRATQKEKLTLLELRAALAWRLDERWSVGGALRQVRGDREQIALRSFPFLDEGGGAGEAPLFAEATGTVDGTGLALALRFAGERWGFGARWESAVELDGRGDLSFRTDAFAPTAIPDFAGQFPERGVRQEAELPQRIAAGAWRALGANMPGV